MRRETHVRRQSDGWRRKIEFRSIEWLVQQVGRIQLIHGRARCLGLLLRWLLASHVHVAHALRDATNSRSAASLRCGITLGRSLVSIGGLLRLLRLLRVVLLERLEVLGAAVSHRLLLLLISSVLGSHLRLLGHAILRRSGWCLTSSGGIGTSANIKGSSSVPSLLLLAVSGDLRLGGVLLIFVGLLGLRVKLARLFAVAFLRSRHCDNGSVR